MPETVSYAEENNESRPVVAASSSRDCCAPSLRILESVDEFEELRDIWADWSDSLQTDLDFFSIRLRHWPGAVRPHVMVVCREGRPDCMLVGWLEQGGLNFKVGSFQLFRSEACVLRFVDGGFLGNQSRANSLFLIREIIQSLKRREAQAVEFSQLRVGSTLYEAAKREPQAFCRDLFTPVETHRYLNLPATFDDFFGGLSRKSRTQFKRCARLMNKDFRGQVRFQTVRSEGDAENFARKADEISRKTYQRALGVGFANNPETRETLRVAAQKDAFRACLLYIGERPVAFASGILCKRTVFGTFMAYDPEFKKYSPGLLSLLHLVEELFELDGSPLRLDAGSGDMPYKRRIFHSSWRESPVWIFGPSAKGLELHALKVISTTLHYFAMKLLANSDYLRKVKKNLHGRAMRSFQRKNLAKIYQ